MAKIYLWLMASGLALVSLTYGIVPEVTVPFLLDVPTVTTDMQHIFRGITGLYLGLAAFWLISSFKQDWYQPATVSVVLFMLGMALGRLSSIIIDGPPSFALIAYMVIEFGAAALGLYALKKPVAEVPEFIIVEGEESSDEFISHWSAVPFAKNIPDMNLFSD